MHLIITLFSKYPKLFIILTVILAVLIGSLIIILIFRHLRKHRIPEDMSGLEFEDYCAELLKYSGFTDVEQTPASADFGVDIFAEKDGISYAFQCKYYDKPVGTKAVQEIYAGRDFYHVMIGVVLTNQTFTKGACKLAEAFNILLWGEDRLKELEENYYSKAK